MKMEASEKFLVSIGSMDNPFAGNEDMWSVVTSTDSEAMKVTEKFLVSYKATDNPFEQQLAALCSPDEAVEAKEKFQVSSRNRYNPFTGKEALWSADAKDSRSTKQKRERISQLLRDLTSFHVPIGSYCPPPDLNQESHIPPRPLYQAEAELLDISEELYQLKTQFEWMVIRTNTNFRAADSQYIDAWEMSCRGLKQMQEGLSTIADAENLLCRLRSESSLGQESVLCSPDDQAMEANEKFQLSSSALDNSFRQELLR